MSWKLTSNSICYDNQWQEPAITEKHAYQRFANHSFISNRVLYFGFPWASLIDGLNRKTELGNNLREQLDNIKLQGGFDRIVTVCQHIKFRDFIEIFLKVGITDIFASHAVRHESQIRGIYIRPFPLYPVVRPSYKDGPDRFCEKNFHGRQYLYSFIGAYDSRYYLTDARQQIGLLEPDENALVIARNQWHYEKRVYNEQIFGKALLDTDLKEESDAQQEYIQALEKTKFSLCPSGTGPNSIRLWESIEFGCIPVILADTLCLPGDMSLWEKGCVFIQEKADAIRNLPAVLTEIAADVSLIEEKLSALKILRDKYCADSFITDIHDFIYTQTTCQKVLTCVSDKGNSHHLMMYLDLGKLSSFEQLVWIHFAHYAIKYSGVNASVNINNNNLDLVIQKLCANEDFKANFPHIHVSSSVMAPSSSEEFVFISGSEVLSRKILTQFHKVYIEPSKLPTKVDSHLYMDIISHNEFFPKILHSVAVLESSRYYSDLLNFQHSFCQSDRQVSIVTSVFKGDQYIKGFLSNSEQLIKYDQCEHFLIRPGSPGNEHALLIDHVKNWQCAIYININTDPGLYEVWNIGARLSTGKYLSNGNLDDRRSPEHISVLSEILDSDPTIDVISSALKVTEIKNREWQDPTPCPVWYGEKTDRKYQVDQLLKRTENGFTSFNMPHCMPIWRRDLHAFNGYFDERQFGPSADWEFWLRVGIRGATFYLVSRPLGLYLKDQDSYWRRSSEINNFEKRIVEEYVPIVFEEKTKRNINRTLSSRLSDIRNRHKEGASFELVVDLLQAIRIANANCDHLNAHQLLSKLVQIYFGVNDIKEINAGEATRGCKNKPSDVHGILEFIISVLHTERWNNSNLDISSTASKVLLAALNDIYTLTRNVRALLASAFLYHQAGSSEQETQLLAKVHQTKNSEFWQLTQSVYRFKVNLAQLSKHIDGIVVAEAVDLEKRKDLNIWSYPDYTSGNTYQSLLYADVLKEGGSVQGLHTLDQIEAITPTEGKLNVLHLHWVNAVFKELKGNDFDSVAQCFLDIIEKTKKKGILVYWTVHNRLNHESIDESKETIFRKALSDSVDRVYVHHPSIRNQVDWLSCKDTLWLVEHGNYIDQVVTVIDKKAARNKLGLTDDDFVIAHTGQIRDYKDFDKYLPLLLDIIASNQRVKLIVAGKISSTAVQTLLSEVSSEQLIIFDQFVSNDDMQTYICAADFGFLSYRAILTSGSLFHTLSFGVPVIAPSIGTIPAYIVDGWNGYTYTDISHLKNIFDICLSTSKSDLLKLRNNAYTTASSLKWQFY